MSSAFKAHKPLPPKSAAAKTAAAAQRATAASRLPKAPAGAGPRPAAVWPKEIDGPSGPEPTRYGDWERNGICSDF